MKTYHVLISENLARTIEIEAESELEAIRMVNDGDWWDKDVVKEWVVDRLTVEAEEVEVTRPPCILDFEDDVSKSKYDNKEEIL